LKAVEAKLGSREEDILLTESTIAPKERQFEVEALEANFLLEISHISHTAIQEHKVE
jgi:hypothetical protein